MENAEKPWNWYALSLKTGKDIYVQLQETMEELAKGWPKVFVLKHPTFVAFEDKGESYSLRLNTPLNNQDGGMCQITQESVFMITTPDIDLCERLGKRWKKQSLLEPTSGEVQKINQDKKKFQLEGGK